MEEWKEYKLGDLIVLSSGGTPNKSNSSYWGGDIPWISAKAMYDDYLYSSDMTITREGLNNGSKLAPVNSILLLTRGSGLFNRIPVCLVKREMAFNQDVKCIESINQNIVSTLFLFYWLMGNKQEISNILETTGIGAGKIDTERLKGIHIKLPPIQIQQVLIQFAESLMLKIEVNRRINENLEQQAQALFKSWFVDFEPFKNGEFVESELGMIPKGWRVGTLGEICSQSTLKVGSRNDVKVLSPVTTGKLLLSEEYFTKQVYSESIAKYKVVNKGAFAYNPARVNIGSLGRNEYDFDGAVSPVYVVFECKKGYSNYFDLFRTTEKFKTEVLSRAIGGVRQSLNYVDFAMIQTIVAPQVVVDAFNPMFERIKTMKRHLEAENDRLATLRDTLLPKLMSGELKINDIKR